MDHKSFTIVVVVSTVLSGRVLRATETRNDVCEYDIDLKNNVFRAKCQGQPLGVNVYANTASVSTPSVKQKGSGGGSSGSSHAHRGYGLGGMGPRQHVPSTGSSQPFNGLPAMSRNATSVLTSMMQQIRGQSSAITNISRLLSSGDNDLRSDLQALRGLSTDDSTSVRESIIATMRNQYNFMRTAILAHNAELKQVLELMGTLLSVTSRWGEGGRRWQEGLQEQLATVNRTMQAMRTTFSTCLRKCHRRKPRRKERCPRLVSAIGSGESLTAPWEQGVVMTDSAESSESTEDRMWVMNIQDSRDQLLQYSSPIDIQYQLVARYFSLPFYCEGTGHVVYRNALFCHKAGTRRIAKYNLKRMEIAAQVELPSAGVVNTFPYQFGLKSDIDLAVDELGLWVVYSTKESAGKMVISKLSPRTLEVEKTWLTSFPKKMVGNSFMICGILYATNSYEDTPTFIRYMYDTSTQQETIHDAGNLVFSNAVAFNSSKQAASVMLDYNSREQKLYSWSKGHILIFPVYLKDSVE